MMREVTTPGRRRRDRLVAFASRGNECPGSVHDPLHRLGLPGWAWRLLTWTLVAVDLTALTRTRWAYAGFFLIFPMLWLVHTRLWAAVLANLLFGAGHLNPGHPDPADQRAQDRHQGPHPPFLQPLHE